MTHNAGSVVPTPVITDEAVLEARFNAWIAEQTIIAKVMYAKELQELPAKGEYNRLLKSKGRTQYDAQADFVGRLEKLVELKKATGPSLDERQRQAEEILGIGGGG